MQPAIPPTLAAVAREVLACRRCPRLVAWRDDPPVPGFGDPDAAVFLLGMATAAGGNRSGRAFTGNRSASFLVAGLHRAGLASQPTSDHAGDGLTLRGAWMASAVRCPPPGNRPTGAERDNCLPHLQAEWRALGRLRVVVALGRLAWSAALRVAGTRPAPPFAHGAEVRLPGGLVLLGCYHPSPQNTNTGLLDAAMLDAVLDRAAVLRATTAPPEVWMGR